MFNVDLPVSWGGRVYLFFFRLLGPAGYAYQRAIDTLHPDLSTQKTTWSLMKSAWIWSFLMIFGVSGIVICAPDRSRAVLQTHPSLNLYLWFCGFCVSGMAILIVCIVLAPLSILTWPRSVAAKLSFVSFMGKVILCWGFLFLLAAMLPQYRVISMPDLNESIYNSLQKDFANHRPHVTVIIFALVGLIVNILALLVPLSYYGSGFIHWVLKKCKIWNARKIIDNSKKLVRVHQRNQTQFLLFMRLCKVKGVVFHWERPPCANELLDSPIGYLIEAYAGFFKILAAMDWSADFSNNQIKAWVWEPCDPAVCKLYDEWIGFFLGKENIKFLNQKEFSSPNVFLPPGSRSVESQLAAHPTIIALIELLARLTPAQAKLLI